MFLLHSLSINLLWKDFRNSCFMLFVSLIIFNFPSARILSVTLLIYYYLYIFNVDKSVFRNLTFG